MRLLEHIERQSAEFAHAIAEATRRRHDADPVLMRRLVVSGAPMFTLMSAAAVVLVTLAMGNRAVWPAWVLGGVAGLLLALLCVTDVRVGHRLSTLQQLPRVIQLPVRAAVGLTLMFGPAILAFVLWWTGNLTILANLAVGGTTALAVGGGATWGWLWATGYYK